MQKLLEAVKGSAWARLGLLALVIAIPTWMFGFTSHERSTIGLAVAGYIGIVAPALILGAAWGVGLV